MKNSCVNTFFEKVFHEEDPLHTEEKSSFYVREIEDILVEISISKEQKGKIHEKRMQKREFF